MPLKRYGIFLAYPPTVDMRDQGLGRHLAMFLKGAEILTDVRFTIVCPSWTRETLEGLFESEQVSRSVFELVTPEGKPYALRLFEAIRSHRKLRTGRLGVVSRLTRLAACMGESLKQLLARRALIVHDTKTMARFLIEALLLLIVLTPFLCLAIPLWMLIFSLRMVALLSHRFTLNFHGKWRVYLSKASAVLASPKQQGWVLRLFDEMQKHEMRRMQAKIAALPDVRAWYCSTAFWPSFHEIKAPRLMCVPDVVLSDFPTGFSGVGGERFLSIFESVERAIRAGEHFVTYSQAVKWNTLVDRYAVAARNVAVIPHAPNILKQYVEVIGFQDAEATSRHYCQTLLLGALQRSTNPTYTATFQNGDVRFFFYASQFRPNKNVLMLLRAFDHLLRKRYLGHKLILTGHPGDMPEIARFVAERRLENDVIFVPGLSISELAACYKLADLAVNPTLSEGGCPFTFTEALSVGTPVVMSRIPVAEEVLVDKRLQAVTFFDPFDWQDCAKHIEWAVTHRDELLAIQLEAYALLARRTWSDVVTEHVRILDEIASTSPRASVK